MESTLANILFTLSSHLVFSISSSFMDIFALVGHFLGIFGLVSPVRHAEILLCAKSSAALMFQAWHKPYYAGHPQKLLSQSHYYTRHIRHNMYIFRLGHQLSSMENFHPLRRTPSHIDAPNSCWCAEPMLMRWCKLVSSPNWVFAGLCRTLNTITPNLLCPHQKNILLTLMATRKILSNFFINLEKYVDIFSATWKILLTF